MLMSNPEQGVHMLMQASTLTPETIGTLQCFILKTEQVVFVSDFLFDSVLHVSIFFQHLERGTHEHADITLSLAPPPACLCSPAAGVYLRN